ncbi:hypothetical protein INR49_016609, partial [Caranx melampygus]
MKEGVEVDLQPKTLADLKSGTFHLQMKDQSKKVANLKHKEQLEKSRNAQLMEEAKKREDNLNESSQQIK